MHSLLYVPPLFTAVNVSLFMLTYGRGSAREQHAGPGAQNPCVQPAFFAQYLAPEGETFLSNKGRQAVCTENSFSLHRDTRAIMGPLAAPLSQKFCTRPSLSCKRPSRRRRLILPFGRSMCV